MTADQYRILTQECDAILDRFTDHPSIIAIPWLHVINNHPNTLHKYEQLFQEESAWRRSAGIASHIAYMGYKLISSLFVRDTNKGFSKTDVVFISHFVKSGNQNGGEDFYYGSLPAFLSSKGISTTTGYINHTSDNAKGLTADILFRKTLSVRKECRIIRKSLRSFRQLRKAARSEKDLLLKKHLREAAFQALSPQTLAALRLYENIYTLVQQTDPAAIIVTWEGWSWERMALRAARIQNSTVYCAGYQHTVLMPGSHAVKRSLDPIYDPDLVLSLGKVPQEILGSANKFKGTSFLQYGSHRKSAIQKQGFSKQATPTILVTPEGIESECVLLFDFAVELALKTPSVNFIFRTHPVLPFGLLTRKYSRFGSLPGNCKVSDIADINADFKRSDFLLYRGSSVVIYAVLHGLRPIYYELPGELSIDPLYMMNEWRISIASVDEFSKAMDTDSRMNDTQKLHLFDPAWDFCNEYVSSCDQEAVYQLLSSRIINN